MVVVTSSEVSTKKCGTCKEVLPVEMFGKATAKKDGLKAQCRKCVAAYRRKWYAEHKEEAAAYAKTRLQQGYRRKAHIKRLYGITMEEYEALTLAQSGRCALCRAPADPLHIDHDHATGKIRELLCSKCNKGLGMFNDDPELMQIAIVYLQFHQEDM